MRVAGRKPGPMSLLPSRVRKQARCSQGLPLTDYGFPRFFPPFPVFKKAFLKPPLPLFALPAFAVSADNKEFLINFSSGILHVVSKLVKDLGEKAAGENQS